MADTLERPRFSLPEGTWPRLLSREQAAIYLGIGTTLFDTMVSEGRLPKPIEGFGRRVLWDRWQIDLMVTEMANRDKDDEWTV